MGSIPEEPRGLGPAVHPLVEPVDAEGIRGRRLAQRWVAASAKRLHGGNQRVFLGPVALEHIRPLY